MKKLILLGTISILMLTTACARSESLFGKVPFLKNIVQEDENGQALKEPKQTDGETKVKGKIGDSSSSTKDSNEGQVDNGLTLESIFFNQVQEVNGRYVIQNPENTMALVNKQFGLPSTFLPNDLVRPKVSFSFGDLKIEKSLMRQEAASALEKMFSEALNNGVELFAVSGYRSYEYQSGLFQAEIKRVGLEKAKEAVAYPGQSEHQTGLTMDISSRSVGLELTQSFGASKEGNWLAENAHRFGFILRYPQGKEAITGYQYEAWHFRYVGVKAATIINNHNWTLEEYFNIVKKI